MFNQRARILQIAAVSIMCLVLVAGVGARGVVESNDTFPVPSRLYRADGPTQYNNATGAFQAEIVSMSLSGETIDVLSFDDGPWTVESFFDVFTELSVDGGPPVTLTGPVQVRITAGEDSSTTGIFDTEIVSMSLSSNEGLIPIILRREAASGMATGVHSITDLGGGLYHIDSFFDVFTELSVDGGESWAVANDSTHLVLTAARLGQFEVVVEGNSGRWNDLVQPSRGNDGWSEDEGGPQWFPYPQEEPEEDPQGNVEDGPYGATWWNEWWYDDPYDADRIKIINLSFNYKRTNPNEGIGYVIVAINWSTTDWSLNPPAGIDPSQQPPLMDFDQNTPSVAWVGRMQVLTFEFNNDDLNTFNSGDIQLPIPYNPEWVSIDVRGYNFTIEGGKFIHECVEDPDLPPEQPDITLEQLNWQGLASSTPFSTWGRVKADYNLASGVYYVNMSIGDAVNPQWVIHNLSIESLGGDQTLMAYFDLGVTDGTDVSSLDYGYTVSNVPLTVAPPITATTWVPDLDFQLGGEGGEDLGSPSAPQINASDTVVDSTNSGVLADKDKFVNQPQGANQCAPGAISNSLKYLQATGKIPAAIPTGIGAVGTVVGTTATGTPASWYKKKATHYKDHVNTRWIEAPLTVAKIQDLVRELKDGQDIEMDLKGHVEVLAGIRLKPDGTVDLDLYDDNQTDDKSDPMHTSPLMTDGTNDKVDGMILERFVIECPKETVTVCDPSFSLNTADEWLVTLEGGNVHTSIKPMTAEEWATYMELWRTPSEYVEYPELELLYPETTFLGSEGLLTVFAGDPDNPEVPDDGGLVMGWGPEGMVLPPSPGNNYASAFTVEYGEDPDLSNCIITVAVTAPQFSFTPPFSAITQVSLGLETPPLGSGNIRSWYWNCGNTGTEPIQWGVPTTITIDTSIAGTTAATPLATNYVSAPGFNLTNVLSILVDENATWMGTPATAPAPAGPPVFMWNYWHWLMVSPKTTLTKAELTKHSQGPIIIDEEINNDPDVPLFWGWDEKSDYHIGPIAADDWECKDNRPVTDFHWWGSFPGWKEPYPPCHPKAFHIGIWTDAPVDADNPWSHPKELVWEHICDNYVWNFAGYDRDPRNFDPFGDGTVAGGGIPADDPSLEPEDACFQYNQLLDGDDWFYQEPMDDGTPRIYWLSIAPIWDYDCDYEWGWKTRPKFFMDNAVSITAVSDTAGVTIWPPVLGSLWNAGVPLQIPAYMGPGTHGDAISWDLAFEISTNEPSYEDDPIPGDITGPVGIPDGSVNLWDLALMASNWDVRVILP